MRRSILTLLLVAAFVVVGAATASPRDYALHAVLASKKGAGFRRYFPDHTGTAKCRIPFGFRSVKGTCTARIAPRSGNSGQVLVNLSERWSWKAFHYSGTPRRPLHHHWVFDLLPGGKVVLIRQLGDFPPNYAY